MAAENTDAHVAPGRSGSNLLSKRHVFRVVLLKAMVQRADAALEGPLVLEAEDGSYKFEFAFSEAVQAGNHLIFEFWLRQRARNYFCYLRDGPRKIKWPLIPRKQSCSLGSATHDDARAPAAADVE